MSRSARVRATTLALNDVWDQLEHLRQDVPGQDLVVRRILEMVQASAATAAVMMRAIEQTEKQS